MSKQKYWTDKNHFKSEIGNIADQMKLKIGTIYLRAMTRKWASITSDGKCLNFNKDLLKMPVNYGKYVIVHELVHLKVPNHGKLFKAIIKNYVRNYRKVAEELAAYY